MTMLLETLAPGLRDFDRLFNQNGAVAAFLPPADVLVTDNDVTIHMDVPSLTHDDLEVELDGDVLTVRGERSYPYGSNGDGTWQRVERGFGKFERTLRVPAGLDPDQVEASLVAGVLTLRIRKPEALKPRRIEIGSGDGQRQLEEAAA